MPEGVHGMIRSVSIHNTKNAGILGFSFFGKEGALLWKIGATWPAYKVDTVLIAENEVIAGVVAKLNP